MKDYLLNSYFDVVVEDNSHLFAIDYLDFEVAELMRSAK